MVGRVQNYRVFNTALGCNCGHHHHSRDSAIRCADTLGWEHDIVFERFDSRKEGLGKKSIRYREHHPTIEQSRYKYYEIY